MDYIFLGGAGEVGASCLLVSVAHRHILFDCGIRVNQTGTEALPDIELLKQSVPSLDAIFVSHAHADHIGALPLAHAAFPQAPICTTEPTQRISAVMLANAVRLYGCLVYNICLKRTLQVSEGHLQFRVANHLDVIESGDPNIAPLP